MTLNSGGHDEFGIFTNWLYTQKLQIEAEHTPSLPALARLWILSKRLLVPTLQNQVIDAIFSSLGGASAARQSQFIGFASLAAGYRDGTSMLARIAAYCLVWCRNEFFDMFVEELPCTMVLAALKRMKRCGA